jgi:DNA-binding transcriptional ArsR family regulator
MAQNRATVTDPQVMRAMTHPARIEIIEHLNTTGEVVTATQMAARVGLSPSATSYHLRELARYGLVEQAPSRGDGRERVWRSTIANWTVAADLDQPEAREAEKALVDAFLTRDFTRVLEWFGRQQDEPAAWRDTAVIASKLLLLTADELRGVHEAIRAVLEPYERRGRLADPPEGARTVALQYTAIPLHQEM